MDSSQPPPDLSSTLVLAGPTASGKSALAMHIARACGAEIIALDSMTLYRGMDIGTAKPSLREREEIPHHLFDILDPWQEGSVAWWLARALAAVAQIQARGRRALFVGGTGLYLKALLCGLFEGPGTKEEVRTRLEAEAETADGKQRLIDRLRQVDPESASRLHPNDTRRIVRALEVWEVSGRPISSWQTQWADTESPGQRPAVFWLDLPRPVLRERINRRVDAMLANGWLEEARALQQLPQPLSATALQALGYHELFLHLDGRLSLEQARERIQARTRQFAKRQVTWFRHLPGCQPVSGALTWAPWNLAMEIEPQNETGLPGC